MEHVRYSVAACQTDMANPIERRQMRTNTDRMLAMVDAAVAGSAAFLPVRLVVFPEFAHGAPVFPTVQEIRQKLTVKIPNEHTERLTHKAREHNLYIQSGSMLEEDLTMAGRAPSHG
jgi:predicted amidohydrolase